MGKEEVEPDAAPRDPTDSDTLSGCCTRAAWKWPIPIILGAYVLAFAIWSVEFRGRNSGDAHPPSSPSLIPHVEASFRLHKSFLEIHESLLELQIDLQNEIGIPDTQIDILAISPLSHKNYSEVRFMVTPDKPNDFISLPELSLLKDTFVELFMQRSANLSLTSTIFGIATHFEVLQFPGGITVIPPQPGFPLSRVLVLFNFTLHNSLSHVHHNFGKLRQQLARGIILKPTESLYVQLTNKEGSTVNSPVVVQTSILPVMGLMLPSVRLKQLAWQITASPDRNLGLNHSLFGSVRKIELSSYLEYSLDSAQSPGPSPAPSPAIPPSSSFGRASHHTIRRHHHHHHHHHKVAPSTSPSAAPYRVGSSASSHLTPEPQPSQPPELPQSPIYTPSYPPLQIPHQARHTSRPPFSSPFSLSNLPPSPSISSPVGQPPSGDAWTAMHAPASFGTPLEAPDNLAPGLSPTPAKSHNINAYTPAGPPLLSSGKKTMFTSEYLNLE
ncbi:hypothetical protein KP509_14G095900 [Ceratopteris richardii]|uniref:DUF7036 domain-containing protein n=2 Tax=Ceratopteris richardii TaxID=49495 RepID=A0A8T2TEH2_CERRI|nr:hypothetical protein KP509_14G095900 [Ceratopteris richardii]KAH7416544.1 hypothetical protein KP509_14G095900 [Ceratopteris richardii]